ncbi:MAG: TlyA family RNA methyltransferase [Microlunatus sp.]|nr:TlyA family RNA methyltransferase [Microlunatus sp.]MDN5770324.1 TlyA family RNA methyltransferase [Microlunatus sp.]MDN5803230.1 TlyA family RNA methyltransferase [Microlunatus sp.]
MGGADRVRLDRVLAERGLVRSRSAATELIRHGRVRVNGRPVSRASILVGGRDHVEVETDPYVSRAAHKLAGALADLSLDIADLSALDAGASTGGFTQVLLRGGCREVIAVDVGHDQLADLIRSDPRVRVLERLNVRDLTLRHLHSRRVDLAVADLSFISLRMVLPALTAAVHPAGSLLLMVKPQFEVGRDRLGEGGVVRSPQLHQAAISGVVDAAAELGWFAVAVVPSRLPGPSGNREFFVLLRTHAPEAPVDLEVSLGVTTG